MSTCNFSQPTLSRIYASELEDEWAWDDLIENACGLLEEKVKNFIDRKKAGYNEKWLDRNKKVIGDIDLEVYNKDYREWETKSIYVTIESGYYSGAKIDVSLHEFEELPEINKTLAKKIDSICFQIEKVLTTIIEINSYGLSLIRKELNGKSD